MIYRISHPTKQLFGKIRLTSSKSESNRALIIQALCSDPFEIDNLSVSDDTLVLKETFLKLMEGGSPLQLDVGAAGTSFRFLTAYLSGRIGNYTLTGSERMKKRPIGILVEALRSLGASIRYLEEPGFPPLEINGKVLRGGEVEIDGSVSSQFISALLLIAPTLQNGLVIRFTGKISSRPYINMTLKMMEEFRVYGQWQGNSISVSPQQYRRKSEADYKFRVGGDWSAASYYYSMVAFANDADLVIEGLNHPSLQGDAVLADLYTFFGVHTEFLFNGIRLTKRKFKDDNFGFDFSDCPDLAQTVAVTVSGLKIPAFFNGVHSLRIKESERVKALQAELAKLGIRLIELDEQSFEIVPAAFSGKSVRVATYDDHRMAMAFAAFALLTDGIELNDPLVVSKSYPGFWDDLRQIGFNIETVNQ